MEITANALQTVAVNQNVIFTNFVTSGNCSILFQENSGLVTVRGLTNQCRARFRITFGANIAVPTGQTAGPISLAISQNGEAIGPTTMTETPTAVEAFNNVSSSYYIDVPSGVSYTISVKNISTIPVNVQNANLIVERVA